MNHRKASFQTLGVHWEENQSTFAVLEWRSDGPHLIDIFTQSSNALTEKKKNQPQSVTVTYPQWKILTKNMAMPSDNPADVGRMVALQSVRQIPISPEEMVSDYTLLPSETQGQSEVLLAVTRQEEVQRLLDHFEEAGLPIDQLVLPAQAHAALFSNRLPFLPKGSTEPYLVVHFDGKSLSLSFLIKDQLRFTRSVLLGEVDQKENPPQWRTQVVNQIRRTLTYIDQKEGEKNKIKSLVLLGSPEETEELIPLLKSEFEIPVERPNGKSNSPFSGAQWSALGAALLKNESPINLIPQDEKRRRLRAKRRKELGSFAALLGFFALSLTGLGFQSVSAKRKTIASLDQALAQMAPRAELAEQNLNRTELIEKHTNLDGTILDVVHVLTKIIPKKVSFNVLTFERERSIGIQGTSFTLSEAVNLVHILEVSPLFAAVELRSSNVRRVRGRDFVDFQITCHFNPIQEEVR